MNSLTGKRLALPAAFALGVIFLAAGEALGDNRHKAGAATIGTRAVPVTVTSRCYSQPSCQYQRSRVGRGQSTHHRATYYQPLRFVPSALVHRPLWQGHRQSLRPQNPLTFGSSGLTIIISIR